ncbi:MAG: ABC transporter substrate-binding protein [Desulfobulbaceae bacterium]|nr:ABC transporter substrate-binding protein [Desulfobulbaceae bacterium]
MQKETFFYGIVCLFFFLASQVNAQTDKVVLQLAWKHQFQFAGYYAALHKGFYRESGLDVTLVEGGDGKFARQEVTNGNAQYGVAGVELLLHRYQGDPFVALAAILQHSASVILSRADTGIRYPQDLSGKKLMLLPGSGDADILSIFRYEGIPLDSFQRLDQTYNLNDLIDGRTDAVSAYVTNEPWLLKQKGIEAAILTPSSYGVDFYSDCLFTTKNEIKTHPERVQRFLKASLRGWIYAMKNKEEIIQLLKSKYKVPKEIGHLRYEAETMERLIFPNLVEMGHMNPRRWQQIVHMFKELGDLPESFSLDGFLYQPEQEEKDRLQTVLLLILIALFVAIALIIYFFNLHRKIKKEIYQRKISEIRYKDLFDHSTSGVAVYDQVDDGQDFIFKDFNKACEKIETIPREAVLGRKVTEVFPGVEKFGLLDVLRQVWQTGEPALHPVSLYKDGKIQGWRENRVYKLPTGEIVAVYDDITKQKQLEHEKQIVETQLQRAQKMEAIGLMAGGVAHDLNNILAGMTGYPELLLLTLPEDSDLRQPIEAIKESGKRAAAVVADLLTVARGAASTRSVANLNTLIIEYVDSPEWRQLHSLNQHIRCEKILDENLPNISCSPIHIKKCIMNLVTNGVEAMDTSGSIELCTNAVSPELQWLTEHGLTQKEYVVLTVTDTGIGIPKDDIEHIFEPFYSKKVMGRSGTGLGLAVVWNTVEDHDGKIFVESSENGTCFQLYFPTTNVEDASQPENNVKEKITGNNERILVVDDEPQLCDIASQMLQASGYNVDTVSSGELAIKYLEENSVDIIVIDMLMEPGMNGYQTYKEMLKLYPDQKAIIVSGFSESDDVKAALKIGATGFFKKPYSMDQLVQAVNGALNS